MIDDAFKLTIDEIYPRSKFKLSDNENKNNSNL